MADTFMRGIDPRLERLFIRIVNDTFVNYNNIILNNIEFKKKKSSVQKKLHDTLVLSCINSYIYLQTKNPLYS